MVGGFALSLENPQQMIGYYVTSWRYKLPADYWDKYPERITAVTQAQVQAAAKKYLDPSRLQIVAVGEPAKVAEVLKGFGSSRDLRYRRQAARRRLLQALRRPGPGSAPVPGGGEDRWHRLACSRPVPAGLQRPAQILTTARLLPTECAERDIPRAHGLIDSSGGLAEPPG